MYFVYILKSVNFRKSYVGHTDNLERRITEHNNGKSIYTRRYKPWKLLFSEHFTTLKEAINKEKYYKSHSGRRELKNIFKQWGIV